MDYSEPKRAWKKTGALILAVCFATVSLGELNAQPRVDPDLLKQAQQVEGAALKMGPWESHQHLVEEATDNIFERQGWDSEADVYARDLLRQIHQVSPFEPQKRQKVFIDGAQQRYSLTHDQCVALDGDVQREGMMLTIKHFKTIAPVALDAMQTRAKGEPFTAEQVQRWSNAIKPVMEDGLDVMQRVSGKLSKTMTEDQRALLKADMEALQNRHNGFSKMVDKWQRGEWDPRDWGLDNDPVHQGAISQLLAKDADRTRLVREAELIKTTLENLAKPRDVAAWERYVIKFCLLHKVSDLQRSQALAILNSSQKQARDYQKARGSEIAKNDAKAKDAKSDEARAFYQGEVVRLERPVEDVFKSMCDRLESEVLTTKQRVDLKPVKSAKAGT